MLKELGTLEELPQEYREQMAQAGVLPLWPMLRNILPQHQPNPVTKPHLWRFDQVLPLLLKAGELTPVEKAERRVLVLSDPGRGNGAMQATATIYVGLQLLLPGEVAPSHRHTPSAARIVVQGRGGYTVVDGEKLPMEEGDLLLTPGGAWHEHGTEGEDAVIWLDALDLPLFSYLEGAYVEESELQAPRKGPDSSQLEYSAAGLLPGRRRAARYDKKYPQTRYPWKRTEVALRRLAEHTREPLVELDYVNPETGESCLPSIGFTAMMLKPGAKISVPQRSTSAVFHVVSGAGHTWINGEQYGWQSIDTFSAPVFAELAYEVDEESFLICIHDAPLQERLGFYEERLHAKCE